MKCLAVSAVSACAIASVAMGQGVQFRVIERTGQTSYFAGGDAVLDMAIQAKVTGGGALATFSFDLVIPGEPDTFGTLARGLTSNEDGTYATTIAAASIGSVGRHGLARTYTYLAGLSVSFNGTINTSAGTFTNTPENQEIGLIVGDALGTALLTTPGVDPAGEGNPSTWAGYGSGAAPAEGETASIAPGAGSAYMAQGQYIDVYRFRYTVTNFSCRTFSMTLRNAQAAVATQFLYTNGAWMLNAATVPAGSVSVAPLTFFCDPAPGCAGLVLAGMMAGARRRRR